MLLWVCKKAAARLHCCVAADTSHMLHCSLVSCAGGSHQLLAAHISCRQSDQSHQLLPSPTCSPCPTAAHGGGGVCSRQRGVLLPAHHTGPGVPAAAQLPAGGRGQRARCAAEPVARDAAGVHVAAAGRMVTPGGPNFRSSAVLCCALAVHVDRAARISCASVAAALLYPTQTSTTSVVGAQRNGPLTSPAPPSPHAAARPGGSGRAGDQLPSAHDGGHCV